MSKLAVAVDVLKKSDCFATADLFKGLPVVLKLGLGILPQLNPSDFKKLSEMGFELFIDAKLHDIPTQVGRAVSTWASLGACYLTLHTSGGSKMMGAAARAAQGSSLRLLGVSVLTSLDANDLTQLGMAMSDVETQVLRLAKLGIASGLSGFVCSVGEARTLRIAGRELGQELYLCTPGLTLAGKASNKDQMRSFTIEDAIASASNLLVVGRAIMESSDPRQTASQILKLLPKG